MIMNELSFDLYKKLYMVRRAEEFIIKHYPEDEMKTPMHMSMGQEAISVGVCHALGLESQVLTSYRSHAAFLAKTGDINRFFAELYGRESGTAQGKAGSMHLAAPDKGFLCASAIVASTIPMAVGVAFANRRKGNGQISCVFFGDGALDEGAFWESLNVACVLKLPVLFVCEDNGFAVHTPTHMRQGYKSITDIVSRFECNVFREDSTDVEIIYQLALEAIESIKTTDKPAFVYLKCYRYLEHVGIYEDFDAGYRSNAEFNEWYKRDCLVLQRKRLIDAGYAEADILHAESLIDEQIKNSIQRAGEAPFPKPEELYRGVFYEKD
jgi:TPP-dependent pyruvate/acetoin dehydrogenase alpha subunit